MFSDDFMRARAPANLDVGVVLGGAFGAIGKHWVVFLIYTLVLFCLPYAVTQAAFLSLTPDYSTSFASLGTLWRGLLISLPNIFLIQPFFAALIGWTVWADSLRTQANARSAISAVGRQTIPLLLVNLLVVLAQTVGTLLLIVPGVIVSLAFWVALPACVVEGGSGRAALSRGLFLTRGQRWRLFLLAIVLGVITAGLSIIFNLISLMAGFNPVHSVSPIVTGVRAATSGIGGVIGAAVAGSAYVELMRIKGGGPGSEVAEVFA